MSLNQTLPPSSVESYGKFASLCADGCLLGEILRKLLLDLTTARHLADLDRDLSALVSFKEAEQRPVHRWFRYKEGFSPGLLPYVASRFGRETLGSVLDMFAGVGTTVLTAQTSESPTVAAATGIEYNPFIADVAATKLLWWKANPDALRSIAERATAAVDQSRDGHVAPKQATIANELIFPRPVISAWLALWEQLCDERSDNIDVRLAKLALLSVVESASNAKKDGRALRIVQRHHPASLEEGHRLVQRLFREQIERMCDDLRSDWASTARATARGRPSRVFRGDGVTLKSIRDSHRRSIVADASIDAFIYSPPYLNFIDYSEVYKVESWLGAYVSSESDLRALREGTLRSHPSITFANRRDPFTNVDPRSQILRILNVIEEFVQRHATSGWHRRGGAIVRGYFEDISTSLQLQKKAAAPSAIGACAVGNSLLAQRDRDGTVAWVVPIPTDLVIAHLVELAGFRVTAIIPARFLQPRNVKAGSSRESLVLYQS